MFIFNLLELNIYFYFRYTSKELLIQHGMDCQSIKAQRTEMPTKAKSTLQFDKWWRTIKHHAYISKLT